MYQMALITLAQLLNDVTDGYSCDKGIFILKTDTMVL